MLYRRLTTETSNLSDSAKRKLLTKSLWHGNWFIRHKAATLLGDSEGSLLDVSELVTPIKAYNSTCPITSTQSVNLLTYGKNAFAYKPESLASFLKASLFATDSSHKYYALKIMASLPIAYSGHSSGTGDSFEEKIKQGMQNSGILDPLVRLLEDSSLDISGAAAKVLVDWKMLTLKRDDNGVMLVPIDKDMNPRQTKQLNSIIADRPDLHESALATYLYGKGKKDPLILEAIYLEAMQGLQSGKEDRTQLASINTLTHLRNEVPSFVGDINEILIRTVLGENGLIMEKAFLALPNDVQEVLVNLSLREHPELMPDKAIQLIRLYPRDIRDLPAMFGAKPDDVFRRQTSEQLRVVSHSSYIRSDGNLKADQIKMMTVSAEAGLSSLDPLMQLDGLTIYQKLQNYRTIKALKPKVLHLLKSAIPEIRWAAAMAVAVTSDDIKPALPGISSILENTEVNIKDQWQTRTAAFQALRRSNNRSAAALLGEQAWKESLLSLYERDCGPGLSFDFPPLNEANLTTHVQQLKQAQLRTPMAHAVAWALVSSTYSWNGSPGSENEDEKSDKIRKETELALEQLLKIAIGSTGIGSLQDIQSTDLRRSAIYILGELSRIEDEWPFEKVRKEHVIRSLLSVLQDKQLDNSIRWMSASSLQLLGVNTSDFFEETKSPNPALVQCPYPYKRRQNSGFYFDRYEMRCLYSGPGGCGAGLAEIYSELRTLLNRRKAKG